MPTLFDTLEGIAALPDADLHGRRDELRATLLQAGEAVMESWLRAQQLPPTDDRHEGFRLLALQRQGARQDPSFNACRESCRELVYQCNAAAAADAPAACAEHLRLGAHVAMHLALFIDGKLENSRLGEFCCAARPLRARDDTGSAATPTQPA